MDEIKVKVDVIIGDKMMNNFMHACDMFEDSKQLGKYEQMVVSGKPEMDLKNLSRNLKDALEKSGMNVVFVSVRQIGPTLTNDYDRYIMPGVSAITDGHKWGMFHKLLEGLGYEVETDNQMKVTSAKLAW
ncbi:MAG: hypothetical protein AABY15_02160 [Nanoarchaeota archaeon]